MNIFHTKDKKWFKKWDEFNQSQLLGNHLQDPTWLSSYKAYGFDLDLVLCISDDKEILGGYLAVIARKSIFKFYIIPQGPIVSKEVETDVFKKILNFAIKRSKVLKSTALQVSIPFSNHPKIKDFTFQTDLKNKVPYKFKLGKIFKYVYAGYGMNWVDLEKFNDFEEYLLTLKAQVRRNIRLSYRKNSYTNTFGKNNDFRLSDIYKLIELNASENNYSVKSYSSLKKPFNFLLRKDKLICNYTVLNDKIVSTGFTIDTNNYQVYLFGGTMRLKPDTKAGYSIHSENIKLSISKGYKGYNISMGGSKGVKDFKSKFGAEEIYFVEPDYHIIHNNLLYISFKVADRFLKKYKTKVSKWIS
ncbi:hypothetical protein [Psychroflexus salis]|uniref:FemAB family protein n=1 Tax=Psychroflexus salis TaxID=1526574 RepID=A0A916ZRN0_9FLAO|nr:hypothetical protein [Psychroflexus salis]GGE10576.1 hypothetical protein GCM10010831_10110 [Psychroflexus salis]